MGVFGKLHFGRSRLQVKRPSSFKFEGAWLHNYGIGLHLIKGCPPPRPKAINPASCHISFQAASLADVEEALSREGIPYVKNVFAEDGIQVSQLFFHDPDDNMIEICNCDVLPVVPLKDDHGNATAATAWPASLPEPAQLSAIVAVADPSDSNVDASSDVDSLHASFEATSLLQDEPAPPGLIACEHCGPDGTASSHDFSFSSSAMSGVVMAGDSFSMSIPAAEDWMRLSDAAADTSSGTPNTFALELEQRVLHA
ncbi:hypothetical protein Vretimale_12539 [Volvox reticuliferus]|uniref:VOC domain-containing protein n=1 Tax=Volvox reticuliferus TaxID=1737510 RepID=A0A8J4LTE6_9CHLO|nr:hypothetical protein Vretimale_12539 [Volvox reticuliferus]